MECEFLCRFLNGTYFIGNPLTEFPETIVAHEGDELLDMVNNFIKGDFKKKVKQGSKKARLRVLWKMYSEIIKMLKLEGALLNHIRPEFLLSHSDYILFNQELDMGGYKEYVFTNGTLLPELAENPAFNY